MNAVKAIAVNTFKEAIRNKILYSLIFFALVMMSVSLVLDQATVGQRNKIIKDMGLASINLFGVMIAIVVGIGLVSKEIEKRTIYTLLAKPVHRAQFLIGKYLGIVLTLGVETLLMTFFFFLLIWLYEGAIDLVLLKAIFLIFIEISVVSAVAIFFSTFSTPFLSGMFTFSVYVIGHLTEDLNRIGSISENVALQQLSAFFYYLLPNLENFNIKGEVVHHLPLPPAKILLSASYGVLYISFLLVVSAALFQRRDFK
jgi:ABC-type transport system involved in multi-copper enzyme maturation permease subunit